MYAYVDREVMLLRCVLETADKRGGGDGFCEFEGFRGGCGDVVCCFGEEEDLQERLESTLWQNS